MDLHERSPEISVVLPTFQLRDRIGVTLRSLEEQTLNPDKFELVFVDDGSDDGTVEILESWQPALRHCVLRNLRNRGRSVARNRGWLRANGKVIVFLDGDMLAHPSLLEIYHERFASRDVDVVSGARWCLDLSKVAGGVDVMAIARLADRPSPKELFKNAALDFETLRGKSRLGPLP